MLHGNYFFVLEKLLILALFASAFHGYGKLWSRITRLPHIEDKWLRGCLGLAAGMGIFIIGMQIIGIAGMLKKNFVITLLALGIASIFIRPSNAYTLAGVMTTGSLHEQRPRWLQAVAGVTLISLTLSLTLDKALSPLVHWDELMYQLPHVREWLSAESLTINEWLRYPYFPYNFNLLYAAIISITGEYDSNLIHAFSGWLIAFLLFRFTLNNHGLFAATLATVLWVIATKWFFGTSYIELGVSLFIFAAAINLVLWLQDKDRPPSFLISSAFFLGLAAGMKYQAIVYFPFFIVAVFLIERRPAVWIKMSLAFIVPCIFWYVRNLILTGNPVTPLAGSIFGYYDWNAGDLIVQLQDIERSRNYPRPEMWLALTAPLLPAIWRRTDTRCLLLLSIYATLVWYFTSHYDRYLVPQYPVLALLGAVGVLHAARLMGHICLSGSFCTEWSLAKPARIASLTVAVLLVAVSLAMTAKKLGRLPGTPEDRDVYINDRAQYFTLLQHLKKHHSQEKIYQMGLEGGLLYGPDKIYGDHFGPWRYRDYDVLSARDLSQKLRSEGFGIIAVNKNASLELEKKQEFYLYFHEVFNHDGAKIYEVSKLQE